VRRRPRGVENAVMRSLMNPALSACLLAAAMTPLFAAEPDRSAKTAQAAKPAELGWPRVVCHVTYGGETVDHVSAPVASPYGVAPVAVGSYFLFRTVLQTAPRGLAAFKVYTYADRGDAPVLIHQQSVAWPPAWSRAGQPGGFTGWQWVYEPTRDGELQYWCERSAP
jgi:hypothetical protein